MSIKSRSKFQHLYCSEPNNEGMWVDFPKPYTSGESGYSCASRKYLSVAKSGPGGPVVVVSLDAPRRMPSTSTYVINSQKAKICSQQFSPFDPNLLATGAEDGTIHLHSIPEVPEDMTENIGEPWMALPHHHAKKVTHVDFHPTVNGCLASASYDQKLAVWDYAAATTVLTYDTFSSQIMDLKWNENGSQMAVAQKQKTIKIFDPRAPDAVTEFKSFSMTKSSKVFWVPNKNMFGAVGFGDRSRREVKLFDVRDYTKPVSVWQKEASGSVLMPWCDVENNILYLFGKGDGSVEWLNIGTNKIKSLGIFRSTKPQKGGCFVPKTGLDVMKCESARFMKLTTNSVVPLSFVVPRKATNFQSDIFPDAYGGVPSLEMSAYLEGNNADAVKVSLNPADGAIGGSCAKLAKKATYAELEAENTALKARVAELEKQLGIEPAEEKAE